jgi:hypothetical protein
MSEVVNLPLARVGQTFPVGTVVGLYRGRISDSGVLRPAGEPISSATVAADESLTFLEVATDQPSYWAAAQVGGVWRMIQATTKIGAPSGGVPPVESVTKDRLVTTLQAELGNFVSVKAKGAKGDGVTDDTAAIKLAIEAAGATGTVFFPRGTYVYTAKGNGQFEISGGITFRGESRVATKLRCKAAPGAAARLFQVTSGRVEFRDLTIEGPTAFAAGDEVSAIACTETENIHIYCRNVRFYRMHVGIRGFSGKYQTIELQDSEVDGGNIGLASGADKQINCYGVLTSTIGPVIAENCVFKRGGSNEAGGTNQAHQIYVTHDTPVRIVNCRFYEHIAGRYIQFNGNAGGAPPTPEIQLISGCYFGKQQVSNIACHSSEKGPTVYRDCVWDVEGTALEIKGPTVLAGGCQFRGGAGNSGQYIQFATSTSLVVEPGVTFKGAPEQHIYSSGNNVDILITGALFEGACKTPMLITGGASSVVRLRDLRLNLVAAGNFFDTFSGTIAILDAQGCDFNGAGNRTFFLEAGSTITLLKLNGNTFRGNATAVSKAGTVTTEVSKSNRGYDDVSFGVVASANTITLPESVETVEVTGAVEVKKINASSKGRRVNLVFASTAKMVDGENLKLAGSFEHVADATMQLVSNGTNWYELGRSVN